MASAKFLEEALSTDVDESAVNAIVGSLETQLVTNTSSLPGGNITTSASSQNSSISNGGPSVPVQKHSVANGETINVLFNADVNKCISTNSLQSSAVNTNATHTVVTAQGIVQNTFNQTGTNITQTNAQKGSENVKLVYQQGNQVVNNRLCPAQTVQNGLVPLTQQNVLQTTPSTVNKSQAPIVIKSTNSNTASTAGIVSVPLNTSAMSQMTVSNATVPAVMTLGKQVASGQQTLVGGSPLMSGNVQILNMRPGVPVNQAQKSITNLTPRVVIGGPQMVTARPGTPGQFTLQTLQGLQTGQGHLLLKTENGQYQLLRVGPAPSAPVTATTTQLTQQSTVATAGGTIRIQQTPTVSQVAARKTIVKLGTNVQNVSIASSVPGTQNSTVSSTTSAAPQIITQQVVTVVATNQETVKTNAPMVTTQPGIVRSSVDNTKEKCRKFLANLLELSSREPKAVERNVRTLIQELIDSKVEPEEFCERLERLLNASPQPCLIGFLKKSLPLLRQSLLLKELVIEGIKPPPANVFHSGSSSGISIHQGSQAQVRLVHSTNAAGTVIPTTVRPTAVQQPRVVGPRPPVRTTTAVIRTQQIQQTSNSTISATNPPALHPVSIGGTQFNTTQQQQVRLHNASRTGANMVRGASPARHLTPTSINKTSGINILNNAANTTTVRNALQNAQNKGISLATAVNKQATYPANKSVLNSVNNISQISRPKERKSFISASAYAGDDDINDVAAMGGVNLAEETQRILGSTEMIGTQIRSCKDEIFLQQGPLQAKIRQISAKHGLEEPSNEVMALISHATQERLKNLIEKLAVIAEHRIDVIKNYPRYEPTQDVKGQLKFLEELDRAERKRHDEQEREMLLRAAKSRSKSEDPEQAKLKAKAKEMQRAEMEELRQRDANLTALQAIGQRKKPKLEESSTNAPVAGTSGSSGRPVVPLRPRLKRVNLRDMLFLLEQEKQTSRSPILCKSYLK